MTFQLLFAVVSLFLRQVPPSISQFRQRFNLGRLGGQFFSGEPSEEQVTSFCEAGQPLLGIFLLEQEPSAYQKIGVGVVGISFEAFFGRADLSPLFPKALNLGPLLVELFGFARPRFLAKSRLPIQ